MNRIENIRIIIADDDPLMRALLRDIIAHEQGFSLVGAAEDAEQCIALALEQRPTVALVDAQMPAGGGLRVCRELRHALPECHVVVLSGSGDVPLVMDMLRAGAVGYAIKTTDTSNILETVRRATRGEGTLPQEIANAVLDQLRRRDAEDEHEARRLYGKAIREFIERKSFAVVFQPIVDVRDRRVVGVEALARFGTDSPDVWFSRAWACGRGPELEIAAIEKAVSESTALPPDVYLSVNVSPSTLGSSTLDDALRSSGSRQMVLEITEQAPIAHEALFSGLLASARALGAQIAVDDVGAGFANFNRLVHIAPEIIKLDRPLISEIDRTPLKQAVAESLTVFARSLGATLVAEGVETENELACIQRFGIEYAQGYLLGRPEALDADTRRSASA